VAAQRGGPSKAARRRIQGHSGDEGRTLFLSISFTHPSLPLFISLTLSLLQIQWSRGKYSEAGQSVGVDLAERERGQWAQKWVLRWALFFLFSLNSLIVAVFLTCPLWLMD